MNRCKEILEIHRRGPYILSGLSLRLEIDVGVWTDC